MRRDEIAIRGECLECGKEFTGPIQAMGKKFCSTKCRNAWHTRRLREQRAAKKEQSNGVKG